MTYRTTGALVLSVALALTAAGCVPYFTSVDPAWNASMLTPDGGDTYAVTVPEPGTISVSASSTNQGDASRAVFFDVGQTQATDATRCATLSSESGRDDQEGVALRIATGDDGRTHAVTVTKNVWLGAGWIFNAHVWDGDSFTLLGGIDLGSVFDPNGDVDNPLPFPWRLCARVTDSALDFIAWPLTDPQPAWGDSSHGGTWTLPSGYTYSGAAGLFAGHLRAGEEIMFSDVS